MYDSVLEPHDTPYKMKFQHVTRWKCFQKVRFLYRYAYIILGATLPPTNPLFRCVLLLSKQLTILHGSTIDVEQLKVVSDELRLAWVMLYEYGLPEVFVL